MCRSRLLSPALALTAVLSLTPIIAAAEDRSDQLTLYSWGAGLGSTVFDGAMSGPLLGVSLQF